MTNGKPLEQVLIERVAEENPNFPDLGVRDYAILKDGPRAYKTASHLVINDRKTGELHHHSLQIKTWNKLNAGWRHEDPNSVTLADEEVDEIDRLLTFLRAVRGGEVPAVTGKYVVIPLADDAGEAIVRLIGETNAKGRAEALGQLLRLTNADEVALKRLVDIAEADPTGSRNAAAALNVGRYREAIAKLRGDIDIGAKEPVFQKHLERNFWIFGSDYGELLARRNWTRDEQQDFMLRRNADGCLEVIEIKTPLPGKQLFRYDEDHKTYFPGPELAEALGQVVGYLEKLDAERRDIHARDTEDVNKISARIIIGRDGNAQQQQALRSLNGHLHRIEVLTFDQLVRIAEQVVHYAERVIQVRPAEEEAAAGYTETDDAPF